MGSFKGVMNLDVRDSTPDWAPYIAPKAPAGAPNVLVILYDDTGLAAWSPFGGRIQMPTMQKLADNGLMYSQWHTTALCSPTRSCLLTGRNHHQNGFACIAECETGYPGSNAHIPMECAYLAEVMRQRGWNTYWLGKNHNVAVDEFHLGSSKRNWPLLRGFDRFYGFFGGECDQWYPTLIEDNGYVQQPYTPKEGYHLAKDLVDKAIRYIRDSKAAAPDKPWFMFFCPGANHAPHHVAKEWADKYKGKFDDGYEAYRTSVLPRMIQKGILPQETELSPMNPMPDETYNAQLDKVRPWASLSNDEKRLFTRMAEVYAGYSEFTDHEVGRLIDYLEESGQLENTLIFYCADNGASAEGGPNGSVNENKFFNSVPDDIKENLTMIDELGGENTYPHYTNGWAMAFSTPFRMFKRYAYQGGVCDPLVIYWPKGIKAKGEVRSHYHHAIDIAPTILECCGLEFPEEVNGYAQVSLPGVSMKYSFDNPNAPTQKETQYYAMMGTRGIWHKGWKAVTVHGPMSGLGHFEKDKWQLFHTDIDRSEAHDVAAENPEKLQELVNQWYVEAGKYQVLPLDDRLPMDFVTEDRPRDTSPRDTYVYYPNTSEVPEQSAVNVRGRSYKILAEVELTETTEGVIFAHGSRFGGHSLFIKDQKLWYVYNFLGIPPEQQFVSDKLKPGKYVLGMEFKKEKAGQYGESYGTTTLYVNDKAVAKGSMRTQTGTFTLTGEGLCIGMDSSDAVSKQYNAAEPEFPFKNGTITQVEVSVGKDQYIDLEKKAAAMMARE
ncbi:MAG: arylsulfatase [Candidatus Bathyarchaeia archaeon]